MKNNIISKEEIQIVNNIIEMTQKLSECHLANPPKREVIEKSSELEQLHSIMYLNLFKDMLFHIIAMKDLLEVPEKDLIDIVTEGGKKSLNEVKAEMVLKAILN